MLTDEELRMLLVRVGSKKVVHVGCGPERVIHQVFTDWIPIHVDIDESVKPDVVDDCIKLSKFENESVDGIYSSHNIEHLNHLDGEAALENYHRVLKPGGLLVITCPDLMYVCRMVVEGKLFDKAYDSPAGPITPADMLYGYIPYARANVYQIHRFGYTRDSLEQALFRNRFFANVFAAKDSFALWAFAHKM